MKKITLGVLFSIIFISCANNENKLQDGYSKKFDTIYKDNSTDIDKIIRTFYENGDILDDYFRITQNIGDKDFAISITQEKKSSSIILDSESLKLFIDNAKTIIDNKGKDLRFDLGPLKNSNMTHSVGVDSGINIYSENILGQSVSYELSKEDIINIEKAFDKYKNEK
jgi:hypothetical protein